MSDYVILAFWGPRKESLDECTARAEACFNGLAHCDPAFGHWFQTGRSLKDALSRPVETGAATIRKLLAAGRNRTDTDRKIIEDLGFHLFLWNGDSHENAVGISTTCGVYTRWVPNRCVLELPDKGPVARRLLRVPVLLKVLKCIISAWEPDEVAVRSHAYDDLRPKLDKRRPYIGWLMYIPSALGPVPPLSPPARVVSVGKKGAIIIATRERFTAANPAHVEALDKVAQALDRAGLLRRVKR